MITWVVTPVYRDVESFLILREAILESVMKIDIGVLQFVVIDDTGGLDPEISRLEPLADVMVFTPPFNLGHQRTIVYALRRLLPRIGDDDLVVTLDADGEDQPGDLTRLIDAIRANSGRPSEIALALRTKRRESLRFKVMYQAFRLLFRALTGTTVRSGNFAVIPGSVARKVLHHPTFDLSYSSAILALDIPIKYVPCERGERYKGRSRMTFGRLSMHGLRMLMPFTDRIAVRALAVFVIALVVGVILALVMLAIRIFGGGGIPEWAAFVALGSLIVSLVALGNFVTLFVLFSQTRAVSLANIETLQEGSPANDPAPDQSDAP